MNRQLRRALAKPSAPATASVIVFLMGTTWLLIEYALRGAAHQGGIAINVRLVVLMGAAGALLGLATRARVSLSGEWAVNAQLTTTVFFVTFLLPAAMLVVYGIALFASAGIVSLEWCLWAIGVVIAWALQIALWAGVIGAVVVGFQGGLFTAIVALVFYVGVVSKCAHWISGSYENAWNLTLPRWSLTFKEGIQDWPFVVRALRKVLEPLDHGRLMSVLATIAAGAALALVASLALRWIRQRLMTHVGLRPYLPMGASPLPDAVPLFERRMMMPIVVYCLIGWSAVLAFEVI